MSKNSPFNYNPITSTGGGDGSGTVTSASVVSANGFAGTVANPTTTPAITLSTTVIGILKGNSTSISAATAGIDYIAPNANNNITINSVFEGFTSVVASGTTITLTAASTPNYVITGSGGQVIQLPNATTLPQNADIFSFNNNQSSGSITVNNASGTLVASIPSGGYVSLSLLDNSTSAGSWDRHDQSPSNVSWSTNTFDYPGSITSATWNGSTIAINRGGTGATTAATALSNLGGIGASILNGQSGTITATATNGIVVYEFTASGNLTLPTAVGNTAIFMVKNRHTANITVSFTGGQNADGSTSISLIPYQALQFISNNTNYNIF